MLIEEILTDLYGQQIKKIEKTEWGDILITLVNGQVIKVTSSEYDGSVDAELTNDKEKA